MTKALTILTVLPLLAIGALAQQQGGAGASRRTDLYHVHFTKAALGKASALADELKKAEPKAPMPGHFIVLRHRSGDSWDYAVIEHLGAKAALEAAGNPPAPGVRDLSEWHNDTYVSGPSWADFTKAMGIGGQDAAKTAASVYVVAVHRAAPGHRDQLESLLGAPPEGAAGTVLLQHVEGGPWNYMTIERYGSWQDFGASEDKNRAEMMKNSGDWFRLRDHDAYHADTVTDRIAP
jgi:hypothetical protein